ncbi:MAG: hypothetical protein ACLP0J_12990 [Solirubrobacteraceae bacterium]|jgi:hypothetical protein
MRHVAGHEAGGVSAEETNDRRRLTQLLLAHRRSPAVEPELVDGTIADELAEAAAIATPTPAAGGLEERNLFGEAQRIVARAASASTRRQYAAIFRAFGDWLAGEFGRPPLVGDLAGSPASCGKDHREIIFAYGCSVAACDGHSCWWATGVLVAQRRGRRFRGPKADA